MSNKDCGCSDSNNSCVKRFGKNLKPIVTLVGLDDNGCDTNEASSNFLCRLVSGVSASEVLYVGSSKSVLGTSCRKHTIDIQAAYICDKLKELGVGASNPSGVKFIGDDCKWHSLDLCETKGVDSGRMVVAVQDKCLKVAPYPACARKNVSQLFDNLVPTVINYETIEYDSGSSVTTGSGWNFTAASRGVYHVDASVAVEKDSVVDTGADPTPNVALYIYINNVLYSKIGQFNTSIKFPKVDGVDFAQPDMYLVYGSRDIPLNAGDKLDVRVNASVNPNTKRRILGDNDNFSQNHTWVTIHYVSNY